MAENVELKARLRDPAPVLERALALGARDLGTQTQSDTYFRARHGRLKLREIHHGDGTSGAATAELIAYDRPDAAGSRLSHYRRVGLDPSTAAQITAALAGALGIRVVVIKRRRLLMFENVRIHLDEVVGLGSFLEFEAVLGPGDCAEQGHALIARLRDDLQVADADLIAGSYADLLG